jgi:dTDP-4-dehydrorhamnose reductase
MGEWVLRGLQEGQERCPEPCPEQGRRVIEGLTMYHDQYRQFIFINDLVAAIFELIDMESPLNETLLVAGPELISRYEFAKRLAQTFGLPQTNIRSIPFDSVPQAVFTSKRLSLDISKATCILKTPMRGIDDGLRAMIALAEEGYRERFDCIF